MDNHILESPVWRALNGLDIFQFQQTVEIFEIGGFADINFLTNFPCSETVGSPFGLLLDIQFYFFKELNTLIDVAEEQLKIDIRKKSGAKQS